MLLVLFCVNSNNAVFATCTSLEEAFHMSEQYDQYYLSYSGAKLPLNLVGQISANEIDNRNTYFGANVDEQNRVVLIHKRVYGDIELSHSYEYNAEGILEKAEIIDVDGEGYRIALDASGKILSREEFDVDE